MTKLDRLRDFLSECNIEYRNHRNSKNQILIKCLDGMEVDVVELWNYNNTSYLELGEHLEDEYVCQEVNYSDVFDRVVKVY